MAKEQPARISYFFGKGYVDLWNTIKEAWALNLATVVDQRDRMKKNFSEFGWDKEKIIYGFKGAISLVTMLAIFIFGSIITAFTTAFHVGILVFFFACIYLGFGLLWLVDRIYIFANKIRNACPNSNCQASFLIPVYECPTCKAKHTNLVPSKYGIMNRVCLCGTKLHTTFLNGRGKLKAYCPVCEQSLSGDTASRQYAFPVIGGPSVGKSCYIKMTLHQMLNDVAPSAGWDLHFIEEKDEQNYEKEIRSLESGVRLNKTNESVLTAYQMMLAMPNEKIGRRIYIYDIAGEMFSSSSDFQVNKAYGYADGFIFIIDPLTLAQFMVEVEERIDPVAYGASSKDFGDILDIMLINLGKMLELREKDTVKRCLAVVINKVDVPTLEEKIGEDAASRYYTDNPETCKTLGDARNEVCRQFLTEYGAGNFVRTAESKFQNVAYFPCSALGHNQNGEPFQGRHVVEPLLWLLQQIDSSVKAAG